MSDPTEGTASLNGSESWRSCRWLIACLYSPRVDVGVRAAFSSLDAAADTLAIKPVKTDLAFQDDGKDCHPRWTKFRSLVDEQPLREIKYASFYPSERQFHEIGYSKYVASIQVWKCTSIVVAIPADIVGGESVESVARKVVSCFSALHPLKYGFLTFLTPSIEPTTFSTGFVYLTKRLRFERSNETFAEAVDVSARRMSRHYIQFDRDLTGPQTVLRHRLRDVYEWNLLSNEHLEASVGGRSLRDWLKNSQLGTLKALTDDLWIWSVPNSKASEARRVLGEAGLLTAPD